jgi:hypothetical protein
MQSTLSCPISNPVRTLIYNLQCSPNSYIHFLMQSTHSYSITMQWILLHPISNAVHTLASTSNAIHTIISNF